MKLFSVYKPVKDQKLLFITSVFLLTIIIKADLKAVEKRDFTWYWFLYEKESSELSNSIVFRPFYLRNTNRKGIYRGSLMPFVYWGYETERKKEWKGLIGLIGSIDYTHASGIKDYDFGFFPFILYGNSVDPRDRYLLIWPFGGTIKGKFAHEEISPWVFPGFLLFALYPPTSLASLFSLKTAGFLLLSLIPVYTTFKDKDYRAWSILWPLIHRGKSRTLDELRVLPFYSRKIKKGFYKNYSYGMLVNYSTVFYKEDVHKTFFLLPFYGKKWSSSRRIGASALFWPLFSWGYDRRSGELEVNLPWPLVQIKDSEDPKIKKRIFFPFYGLYKYGGNETFFVTPAYFTLKKKTASYTSEYYISLLVIWYFKRDYKYDHKYYGKSWRYFKFWPFFQYEKNDRGDTSFNFLSLLPFRDPSGYEKMYQPFWSFLEYRKFSDGEKRLGILLRTYYQRWNDKFFTAKMTLFIPIFTYSDYNDKVTEFSFLFSMFAYTNSSTGSYIRLFWIPVRIGEGDSDLKEADLKKREGSFENEELAFHYLYNFNLEKSTDNRVLNNFTISYRIF
jgi:hypothetical protein